MKILPLRLASKTHVPHANSRFCLALLILGVVLISVAAHAQLSQNSGINAADSYVVVDISLQSQGTATFGQLVASRTSGPLCGMTTKITHGHYHVEAGFDQNDQSVINITPTDTPDAGATNDEVVSLIQIRSSQIILYDGNGNVIPIAIPVAGLTAQYSFLPGISTTKSLSAFLTPFNIQSVVDSLGGNVSVTENGLQTLLSINSGNTPGAEDATNIVLAYTQTQSGWTLNQINTTGNSAKLGSVTSSVNYYLIASNISQTGDARRAAYTPSIPMVDPTTAVSPQLAKPDPYPSQENPINPPVGPGPGSQLTLVHGLFGTSKSWTNWMSGQLQQDLQLGTVIAPTLGWSNSLEDQTATLASTILTPSTDEGVVSFPAGNLSSIVIGHSQGGLIARRFGQLYPNLTNGVITVDTPNLGAFIAETGPYAAMIELQPLLCLFPDTVACGLGAFQIANAVNFIVDLTMPAFADLSPGSQFLNTLNSSPEYAPRISIESHANKRWVMYRLMGDWLSTPGDPLLGNDVYYFVQGVYYYEVARAAVDAIGLGFSFFNPISWGDIWYFIQDLVHRLEVIGTMDAEDFLWDVATGAVGDSSDGLVPGGSQQYPNATARYIIPNADTHTGNMKSDYVKSAIESALAQQFAVPGTSCSYTMIDRIPLNSPRTVPFYGGYVPVNYPTGNGPNCPSQMMSRVAFAENGTNQTGSPAPENLLVDFNVSPMSRTAIWTSEYTNLSYQIPQDGMPTHTSIGSIGISGQDRFLPIVQGNTTYYHPDTGIISVTVNGQLFSVNYGSGSTVAALEDNLVQQINQQYNPLVNSIAAGRVGNNLMIVGIPAPASRPMLAIPYPSPVSSTDYTFTATSVSSDTSAAGTTSFPITVSAPTLLGNP